MTPARFPHSDTPGSTLGCQLPRAYRRLLRPSSALDAKASTTCPLQLVTHTCTPKPTHTHVEHDTPQRNHTPPPQSQREHAQTSSQPHPNPHRKTQPGKPTQIQVRAGYQMLASTIQISNNNPTPPPTPTTPTPPPPPPPPTFGVVQGGPGSSRVDRNLRGTVQVIMLSCFGAVVLWCCSALVLWCCDA